MKIAGSWELATGSFSYRMISNPSRSFGSNQVDFGGMMPPASEIAIRSSTVTGTSRTPPPPCRSRRPARAPGAARAADEIDPLVGAHVADAAACGSSTWRCSSATSRLLGARVVLRRGAGQIERVPAARPGTSTPRPCRRGVGRPVGHRRRARRSAARNCSRRARRRDPSRCGCREGSAPGCPETRRR